MTRVGIVAVAALLAVVGCGGAVKEGSPVTVPLDEVELAVGRTLVSSGEFVERQVIDIGAEGTIEWTVSADLDGAAGNYRLVNGFSANPPELRRQLTGGSGMAIEDLRSEVLRVDDMVFLTMSTWPPHLRGRWLRYTIDEMVAGLAGQGVEVSGDRRTPSRLLALIGSAERTADRSADRSGATNYRLAVPAPVAVSALGAAVQWMFARQQISNAQLAGSVSLEVVVDGQGRVESARMEASDLIRQIVKLSGAALAADDIRATIEVRLANFGKSVSIVAPGEDRLIDPAEMNR